MSADSNCNIQPIPEPTLRRLPLYYQLLSEKHSEGVKNISCTEISNKLDFTAIQIRKDLSYAGAQGRSKTGYDVKELLLTLEDFLGYRKTKDALIVGAGNLGMALMGYDGFKNYGLNIVVAFDTNIEKVGKKYHGKEVFHMSKIEEMIKKLGIPIGILTVPKDFAQETADIMVNAGIKAIWNFAPVKISVPDEVMVQHENLASSLAVLSHKLDNLKTD